MKRFDIYRRLVAYLKPYRLQVFVSYAAVVISIVLSLFVPQIIKDAIDSGLVSGKVQTLLIAAGIILALSAVRGINEFAVRYYGLWLSHIVAYDLRNDFYDKVQRLPFAFHDRTHTGDLMSRAISDIAETERFVGQGLMDLLATLILLAGVMVAMVLEGQGLSVLALLPIPLLLAATLRFGSLVVPKFREIQEQVGLLSTKMQESLTGIRVVKAFAREPHELAKFDRENNNWFDKRYDLIQTWANNWPFFNLLLGVSILLLLWFGGPLVLDGTVTVGSLFALISYILMLNGPVQRLGFLVNRAATASASASRVFRIMDMPNEVADQGEAVELPAVRGEVRFEQVCFAYQTGRTILQDVTFTAAPGQTVALLGPTGSGKSTLTNLIPRFYNATGGQILVDGVDIQTVKMESLRRHIGIVLQDPFLFSLSIAENIAYGRPGATQAEIEAAAVAANAHDFISRFPEGYQTRVGERGVTLSGGQKQRVAIARALLADPRILILDDSTSSVDTETEYQIQRALRVLMEGRTTFVIAQRLLTLKNADMILVLDDGRIVQRGTHDELVAQPGLYQQIYELQLKDQETFLAQEQARAR